MARKPLADAAASKLAKRQEGKGDAPTLLTPRKIATDRAVSASLLCISSACAG